MPDMKPIKKNIKLRKRNSCSILRPKINFRSLFLIVRRLSPNTKRSFNKEIEKDMRILIGTKYGETITKRIEITDVAIIQATIVKIRMIAGRGLDKISLNNGEAI